MTVFHARYGGKLVSERAPQQPKDQTGYLRDVRSGLVVGTGGPGKTTIYAMAQAGTKQIYIWNRTVGKVFRMFQDFQNVTTTCIFTPAGHLLERINAPDVIIPGEGMPTPSYVGLSRNHRGLCIERVYMPRVTNLLGVVRSCSEGTRGPSAPGP